MSGMGADTTLTSLLPNQAKAFGDCPSPRCLYSGDVAVGTVPRYCRLYVVGQVVHTSGAVEHKPAVLCWLLLAYRIK